MKAELIHVKRSLVPALFALVGLALAPSVSRGAAADEPKSGAASGGAAGGVARYRKQEREVEGVPQTQLTKPQAPPKETKRSGPTIPLEEFLGQRTEKIQKITDQQI